MEYDSVHFIIKETTLSQTYLSKTGLKIRSSCEWIDKATRFEARIAPATRVSSSRRYKEICDSRLFALIN